MIDRYRILALDYGTKRIGIAISDELRMLASARGILFNTPELYKQIIQIVEKDSVKEVILGLPKTMAGTDSDMTREVREFGEKLQEELQSMGVSMILSDERFTSTMANRNIAMSGLKSKARKSPSLRDEEAARILLQEYLDSRTK